MRLRPEHRVHRDVMFLGVQMGQHLKIVAQRQRGMVRLPGQELVVKTAAVADAVSLGVEDQRGISTSAVSSWATGSSAMGSGIPA